MKMKTVNIGSAGVKYLEAGQGQTTMIFLHAAGLIPHIWMPIASEFTGRFRIIMPFFCDYRDSEADPNGRGIPWTAVAGDLKELCLALDIERPIITAHSMGAGVSILASAINGLNPRAMLLFEPIFFSTEFYIEGGGEPVEHLASGSVRRRNRFESQGDFEEYLNSKAYFRRWDSESLRLYSENALNSDGNGGLKLKCRPDVEASLLLGCSCVDPWPLAAGIECPVHIVEGGESEFMQYMDLRGAASRFPRGSYSLLNGAGHMVPLEKPAECRAIAKDFFK